MLFLFSEIFQFIYQFFKKNNRFVGLLGFGILAYLAGSANPNTTTDYSTYAAVYSLTTGSSSSFYFERGYSELEILFNNLGWNYAEFRMFFAFFATIILYIGVARFSKNMALFCSLYGVTIFFNDATQIRNYMMIAFVVLGLSFLIKKTKKNLMTAGFLILLSAQFQTLGYVFLLVIPVQFIPIEYLRKSLVISILATVLLIVFTKLIGTDTIIQYLTKFAGVISSRANLVNKVSEQYTNSTSLGKVLLVGISTFSGLVLENYLLNRNFAGNLYKEKLKILYAGILISVAMLPMLFIAVDYSRIQRNAFLFLLISIALYFENSNDKLKDRFYMGLAVIFVCFAYAGTHFYIWGPEYQSSILYLTKLMH